MTRFLAAVLLVAVALPARASQTPPTNLNCVPKPGSATSVTCTWNIPTNEGVAYQVECYTDTAFTAGLKGATSGVNATSVDVTGMTGGTPYHCRVRAYPYAPPTGSADVTPSTTTTTTIAATTTSSTTSTTATTATTSTSSTTSTTAASTTTTTLGSAGTVRWTNKIGGTLQDSVSGLAVDASGNVYAVGYFQGTTAALGGACTTLTSMGATDGFVVSYTQAGACRWATSVGGSGGDQSTGVAIDANGDVLVIGDFVGTATFGGQGTLTSAGGSDIYVMKLNPTTGAVTLAKRFGGTSANGDVAGGIAADGTDVIIGGTFRGSINLGGGTLNDCCTTDPNIFVAKLTTTFAHTWSKTTVTDTANETLYSVAVDASHNVFATGSFSGTINAGGSDLVFGGGTDIFAIKYTSAGAHSASIRYGSTGNDAGRVIRVDSTGAPILGGQFQNATDFGGTVLTSPGGTDGFLAKLTSNLATVTWVKQFAAATSASESTFGVAIDGANKPTATGSYTIATDFGGGSVSAAGFGDIFTVKLSSTGTHTWSNGYGSTDSDTGTCAAADQTTNIVYAGGAFIGTVTFGAAGSKVSAGGADGFVMALNP